MKPLEIPNGNAWPQAPSLELVGASVLVVAPHPDEEWVIVGQNARAARLLRMLHGARAELPLNQALPREIYARLLSGLRECRAAGQEVELEVKVELAGQTQWLRAVLVPHVNLQGALQRIVVTVSEVTRQKRAEVESLSWELRFRNLVEECIQGVVVVRHDRVLFCNPSFRYIFGFETPAEAYRLASASALLHESDRDVLLQDPSERTQARIKGRRRVIRAKRCSGEPIWIEASGGELLWDKEPAIHLTIQDVTDRMVAEEALRQCSEQHRTFQTESCAGLCRR